MAVVKVVSSLQIWRSLLLTGVAVVAGRHADTKSLLGFPKGRQKHLGLHIPNIWQ